MNPSGRPDYAGFRRRRANEDTAGNAAVLEIWANDPANIATATLTSPVLTIGNDGGTTKGLTVNRDGLAVTAGGLDVAAGGMSVVNTFTGDDRGFKVSGTVTTINLTDGYGFHEVDLTLAGTLASHSAASSSWVNITGTAVVGAGNYICARNDGIYEANTATITNALLIFGARMQYIAGDTDGLRFPFSINTNNAGITALFDCQTFSDFGTNTAWSSSTPSVLIPFGRDAGGNVRYVPLYTGA
jgi:hypothetical protein